MAETRVIIPIGLNESPAQPAQPQEQPRPESGFVNNQYVPPTERVTLHKTRLGASMARRAEAKAATPAPQPSQSEALSQQVAALQTTVAALAANQLSAHSQSSYNMSQGYGAPERGTETLEKLLLHNQYGSGPYTEDGASQQYSVAPDQPNPLDHDFYDDESAAEFHHLNNGYIERTVQRRLEAERAAQQQAARVGELTREAEALRVKFGRDANFDQILPAAGALIAESGFKLTAEEAYLRASSETEARSGRRGSSYLPKDVKTLGAIMRYNRDTGRSR